MIYFVRHGESEANLKGVFAGQREDSMLTQKGREQARATAQAIKLEISIIDRIISSPLKRTTETAKIIAEEIGYGEPIEIDNRITEYDMGSLTGTPLHKVSSLELTTAENAEDADEFHKRVYASIAELSAMPGNILVVSHAGVGRMLETIKQQRANNLFYDLPPYPNASVNMVDWLI